MPRGARIVFLSIPYHRRRWRVKSSKFIYQGVPETADSRVLEVNIQMLHTSFSLKRYLRKWNLEIGIFDFKFWMQMALPYL